MIVKGDRVIIAPIVPQKIAFNLAPSWGYKKWINPIQNIQETTENLLHIPNDYFIKANFQGFTKVVDLLGGVDVTVEFPFATSDWRKNDFLQT